MFGKKKKQSRNGFQSQRTPQNRLDTSFRRNTVVVSKSQRELKEHQQSVTQRQYDKKKSRQRRAHKIRLITVVAVVFLAVLFIRFQPRSVAIAPAEGYVLPPTAAQQYEPKIAALVREHATAGQIWLLDEPSLAAAIQREYPEISGVITSHRAPLSTEVSVELAFRTPQFVWRDANKQTQFVDSQGILFSANRVRGITPDALVHIEDQSGVVLDAGTSVLTRPLVEFVGAMPAELKGVFPDKKTEIKQVIIPESIREIHVRFDRRPYLVKFSSMRPLPEQVGELRSLAAYLERRGITPRSYVDLRTPLKAYYK